MTPECLILIARLCLPPSVQSIEFHNSPVGAEAVAQFQDASFKFDIWSDSISTRNSGLSEFCERGACVHFTARPVAGPGVAREYRIRFDDEGTLRLLFLRAADQAGFDRLLGAIRLDLSDRRDGPLTPLKALAAAAPANGAVASERSVPGTSAALALRSDAFKQKLLNYLAGVTVSGVGMADVTSSVVAPGFAEFCPRTDAWRARARLLETTTLKGGNDEAEERMRRECGVRVFINFASEPRHFIVVYSDVGPPEKSTMSTPDGRRLTVIVLPRSASSKQFEQNATAAAERVFRRSPKATASRP